MKELVGECAECRKSIYCFDGFLDGVISENRRLYCFSCKGFSEKADTKEESDG